MDIKIKTTDYQMTPEVSDYLNEKIATLEKHVSPDGPPARCEIEVGRSVGHHREGEVWRAEMQIIRGAERLRAESTGESVNAAIDAAKDEILRQLRHVKGKRFATMRRAGKKVKDWMRFGRR